MTLLDRIALAAQEELYPGEDFPLDVCRRSVCAALRAARGAPLMETVLQVSRRFDMLPSRVDLALTAVIDSILAEEPR